MLSAEPTTDLDAGRAAVDREEEEGEEVTPHELLMRTLEGANTNPCPFSASQECEGGLVW